jgi:hypothetical protein
MLQSSPVWVTEEYDGAKKRNQFGRPAIWKRNKFNAETHRFANRFLFLRRHK